MTAQDNETEADGLYRYRIPIRVRFFAPGWDGATERVRNIQTRIESHRDVDGVWISSLETAEAHNLPWLPEDEQKDAPWGNGRLRYRAVFPVVLETEGYDGVFEFHDNLKEREEERPEIENVHDEGVTPLGEP